MEVAGRGVDDGSGIGLCGAEQGGADYHDKRVH